MAYPWSDFAEGEEDKITVSQQIRHPIRARSARHTYEPHVLTVDLVAAAWHQTRLTILEFSCITHDSTRPGYSMRPAWPTLPPQTPLITPRV